MHTQPIILRHSYTRHRDTARAALRYYQMRPRGADERPRSLFTRDGAVSRAEAYQLLDAHQSGRYLAHRLMLSPPIERCPDDLRSFTRHVMHALGEDRGQTLHWVAVEHRNTAHPHVHILLCGGGERGDAVRDVRLSRDDHVRIKADGEEYCRLVGQIHERWDAALTRTTTRDRDEARADRSDPDR